MRIPAKLKPGMKFFVSLSRDQGKLKAVAAPMVRATALHKNIYVAKVPVPGDAKVGSTLRGFQSHDGTHFSVQVPRGKKANDVLEVVVDETLRKETEQKAKCLGDKESIKEIYMPLDKQPGDLLGMEVTPLNNQFAVYFPKGSMPGDTVPFIIHDGSIIGGCASGACESPCLRFVSNACREICAC